VFDLKKCGNNRFVLRKGRLQVRIPPRARVTPYKTSGLRLASLFPENRLGMPICAPPLPLASDWPIGDLISRERAWVAGG